MLRLYNLQRARFLKQEVQNITIKIHALRNDFTKSEMSEMFDLKDAETQSTNTQFLTSENSIKATIDALLSKIPL